MAWEQRDSDAQQHEIDRLGAQNLVLSNEVDACLRLRQRQQYQIFELYKLNAELWDLVPKEKTQ